jgi:hypothetical protein
MLHKNRSIFQFRTGNFRMIFIISRSTGSSKNSGTIIVILYGVARLPETSARIGLLLTLGNL